MDFWPWVGGGWAQGPCGFIHSLILLLSDSDFRILRLRGLCCEIVLRLLESLSPQLIVRFNASKILNLRFCDK